MTTIPIPVNDSRDHAAPMTNDAPHDNRNKTKTIPEHVLINLKHMDKWQ